MCETIALTAASVTDEYAVEAKIAEALTIRDSAIICMSRKDKQGLKALLMKINSWRPCAIALRHTGLPFIFMDTQIWAELKLS